MKSTCQKKFYRKIAPLVKSILKIWLGLSGAQSRQVSASFVCTLLETPKSEGHRVTRRMAVYLEPVVGAVRSTDSGGLLC